MEEAINAKLPTCENWQSIQEFKLNLTANTPEDIIGVHIKDRKSLLKEIFEKDINQNKKIHIEDEKYLHMNEKLKSIIKSSKTQKKK